MTSTRWLLTIATGLFLYLITADVQAFRLRDLPSKPLLISDSVKKSAIAQSKCDSCEETSTTPVSLPIIKNKVALPQSFVEKSKVPPVSSVKTNNVQKKGVQQIRPGFRIKIFKKGESDDDDDEDDDSEDDNQPDVKYVKNIVSSDNDSEGDSNENLSENETENDSDDDNDDSDAIDDNDNSEDINDDGDSEDYDDDDDDDDDDDSEDDDDSNVTDDDDDDNSDEDTNGDSENEDSDAEKTGSDSDIEEFELIRKANLKSSIDTVKSILKETLKPKLVPVEDKKDDKINLKNTEIQKESKKDIVNSNKKDIKIEEKKVLQKEDVKKDTIKIEMKIQPIKNEEEHKQEPKKVETKKIESKYETNKDEVKKVEVKHDIKKDDVKKQELKHDSKKEEEKKQEIKHDVKKDQEKKQEIKHDAKKDEEKKHDTKKDETKKHDTKKDNYDFKKEEVKAEKHEQKGEQKKTEPKSLIKSSEKSHTIDSKFKSGSDSKTHEEPIKKEKHVSERKVKIERKSGSHESYVQQAIHRKNLRESDFIDYYTFFPTFAPNFSRIHNSECRRHGQILIRQLKGAKIWPLQILDSTAKLPSGMLKGNGNQLGDFDQCLATNAKVRLNSGSVVKIVGKYCLAQVDMKPISEEAKLPVNLAQARSFIRSVNTDPGHFIPRFTSLNWGICLPAACDAPEAEFVLRDALRHYNGTIGMRIMINVDPINCYTEDSGTDWDDWLDVSTIATLVFYVSIISIAAYATIMDILSTNKNDESTSDTNDEENKEAEAEGEDNENNAKEDKSEDTAAKDLNPFVKSFSLKQTTAKLMSEANVDGDIECIHGIRALCSLALYVAHKLIPLAMIPYTNRVTLTETSNSPFSIILRASMLYTDSFLLLSGILTAYHMSQDLDRTGSIPWMKRYIARYLRLTPALLAVLLWYSTISDKIGDGPMWGTIVTQNAELCQENMWQNLFYIQNFFSFETMCAPHTHQLALDMQLWWLAPASVWILRSRPTWALVVLGGLHSLTVWLRYSTTQSEYLSLVIYHGISLNQLYRTANFCYSLALHRATPYLAGISLGVLLQQSGKELKISKILHIPGWISCLYFGLWSLYTPAHLSLRDYRYDAGEAAQYAALASVAWSLSLSWIIFACFTGSGGYLNKFLCSKPLVFISRISYSMYLCQFLIFFYNIGSTRTSTEFSIISALNIPEFVFVIVVSTIITLLLDIPMQSAKKSIMSLDLSAFGKKESPEEENNAEETRGNEENKTEGEEEQIQEEMQVEEVEEVVQGEIYEYEEEPMEDHHYQIEQDVIYEEEEEEYDPDMAQEQYDMEDQTGSYEGEDSEQPDGTHQGEEDEDLDEWEWTNGELCYRPRT